MHCVRRSGDDLHVHPLIKPLNNDSHHSIFLSHYLTCVYFCVLNISRWEGDFRLQEIYCSQCNLSLDCTALFSCMYYLFQTVFLCFFVYFGCFEGGSIRSSM